MKLLVSSLLYRIMIVTNKNEMTRRSHVTQAIDEEICSRAKSRKTKWQPYIHVI